ncbi:hypothetical protein ACTZWW_04285 [Salinarimonas sp. NSM]|uniref:hypothetical protein n=1 Tax=Salinarimonas sp. NSM TaxID=3458003 RepID=UPI0040365DC1
MTDLAAIAKEIAEPVAREPGWHDYAGTREELMAWCAEAHRHLADLQMAVLSADHARTRFEAKKLAATVATVVGTIQDMDALATEIAARGKGQDDRPLG